MDGHKLIEVNRHLTYIAPLCPSEKLMPAIRADISCFLIFHPLFSSIRSPLGDSPENNLLSYGHGEFFDMCAGETIAFVASGIPLLPGAILNDAHTAKAGGSVRQAAFTFEIFYGHFFQTRQFPLIYRQQTFQEFLIVIAGRKVHTAHAAV